MEGGPERHCNGRELAIVWLWPRRDITQHSNCGSKLGKTVAASTIAFIYLEILSRAHTNNTKCLADSKELTGLCAVRSGRGLIKIMSMNCLEGLKTFTQSHSEWPGYWSRVELGTSGQEWNFRKINCCKFVSD
jgi:hypothetical protein